MCGLAGIFAYANAAPAPSSAELIRIRDQMAARGPDGVGEWWNASRRAGLGHRRLSIIDLSDRALQPMTSTDGDFTISFNGEIYNYAALRQSMVETGYAFRTTSDTEVLLALYAAKGAAMVEDLRGMFALAIYDRKRDGLFLARDPYGIKPLYYADGGGTIRYASQVKALLAGGGISREIEPAGLVGFHLFGSVPEPHTLYRDIKALPAGSTVWVDKAGVQAPRSYASIASVLAEAPREHAPLPALAREALLDSVRHHLVADVEVGAFLSSGIDSGALVGLMRDAGQAKVRTITLAFEEFRGTTRDEAPLAEEVARLYGATHQTRVITGAEFQADLPLILKAMDQPSIDGVNTWFVAKAARELGLKVALSGVGGDELMAGYSTFRDLPRWTGLLSPLSRIPGLGRAARGVGQALGLGRSNPKLPSLLEYSGDYARAYLLRRAVIMPSELSKVMDPEIARLGLERLRPVQLIAATMTPDPGSPTGRVAALESGNYMRNQLLRDADWAGMAHSLEIRTPLVDFSLLKRMAPAIQTLDGLAGKRALANAPSTPLPDAVINRPKTGFGLPTAAWTRKDAAVEPDRMTSRNWGVRVLEYALAGEG